MTLRIAITVLLLAVPKAEGATYTYDDLGRLKTVTNESGESRTYVYDAVGNILRIEAGTGGCPVGPPEITQLAPISCGAGTSCAITIDGDRLDGAGVSSGAADVSISDCIASCTRVRCLVSPSPLAEPGSVAVEVSTSFGSTAASLAISAAPSLDATGQVAYWHFAGNQGDVVTISMTRLPTAEGASQLDPQLELRDSRGFVLASDDDGGSAVPPGPGRNAMIAGFALPATDTYTVVARGAAGTSGAYVLSIEPSTLVLVAGQVNTPGPELPDYTFAGEVAAAGSSGSHRFAASFGATVTIEAIRVANEADGSGTLDPRVALYDSRGVLIRADDDSGTNRPPGPGRNATIASFVLRATDSYELVVTGSGGTTGPYEVKVFVRE